MIRINCPFCGERDHAEFTYGADASIVYPSLDADADCWHDAIYLRENICGVQEETWHHTHGCRMWLIVERDTMTHEVISVRAAHDGYGAACANSGNGKADPS